MIGYHFTANNADFRDPKTYGYARYHIDVFYEGLIFLI